MHPVTSEAGDLIFNCRLTVYRVMNFYNKNLQEVTFYILSLMFEIFPSERIFLHLNKNGILSFLRMRRFSLYHFHLIRRIIHNVP